MSLPTNDGATLPLNDRAPMPLRKRILVLDAISFQGVWFTCVLSGAYGMPFLGVGAVGLYALLHTTLITKSTPQLMGSLLLICAGIIADVVLTQSSLLAYTNHNNAMPMPPVWIVCLWAALAFSMTGSLRWLAGRPLLGFALFGLSGALSYRAGIALGAAEAPISATATFATVFICFGLIGYAFGAGLIRLNRQT